MHHPPVTARPMAAELRPRSRSGRVVDQPVLARGQRSDQSVRAKRRRMTECTMFSLSENFVHRVGFRVIRRTLFSHAWREMGCHGSRGHEVAAFTNGAR